jgi:amino acid transporter
VRSDPRPGGTGTVAARVQASVAVGDPRRSLRRDSVRFARTVSLSVGIQGPTAGVIVGPAVLAGIVGGSGALAYLLALVAMSFVAYAFVLFSRSFNSASSVFAFNGSVLGASYGFVSVWMLLLVYVSFAAGVYASTADIAGALLQSLGIHVGWVVLAVAGWAVTMVFAYVSISRSAIVILICEGVAIALIAVVGVAALITNGHHHAFSTAPFRAHGIALSVLGLGVVNGFGGFSGFEGAATLGEEATSSQRTIPAAVVGSLLLSAGVYIVFTWIVDNAYASPSALAADPAPMVHLATSTIGPAMGKLVNVAGVISAFGAQLACINAANRLLFSLGREVDAGRHANHFLVRTSARHGSPTGALAVTGSVSLATLLAFSFERSPIRALTFIVEYGAYLIVGVYLLTVIAGLLLVWHRGRRPIQLLILGLGIATLAYVLYDTFVPLPTGPFRVVALTAAVSVVAGVVLTLVPGMRRRLGRSALLRAASIESTDLSPARAC